MKSSAISSAKPKSPASAGRSRREYALDGPSASLDPLRDAVRADLADIRLADRVFAPHYAQPLPVSVMSSAPLLSTPDVSAEELGVISAGETFDLLERATRFAWGISAGGLVGYVDIAALGEPVR